VSRDREAAAELVALRVTGCPIGDGDEGVSPDATIGDMIRHLFDAPNRCHRDDAPEAFMSDVLLCTMDDLEVLSYAQSNDAGAQPLQRILDRMQWRLKIAYWLDCRLRDATEAAKAEPKAEKPAPTPLTKRIKPNGDRVRKPRKRGRRG
jgi:hypothetical protein